MASNLNIHFKTLLVFRSIKSGYLDQNDNKIVKTLLFGLDSLMETQNTSILNATMEFLMSSNRFDEQLYEDHMNK